MVRAHGKPMKVMACTIQFQARADDETHPCGARHPTGQRRHLGTEGFEGSGLGSLQCSHLQWGAVAAGKVPLAEGFASCSFLWSPFPPSLPAPATPAPATAVKDEDGYAPPCAEGCGIDIEPTQTFSMAARWSVASIGSEFIRVNDRTNLSSPCSRVRK